MLNRRILRVKAFKVLYAYAENPDLSLKEVLSSLDASAEEESIRIFRLADGGIAANWYGMTFYAVPVE